MMVFGFSNNTINEHFFNKPYLMISLDYKTDSRYKTGL